MSTSHDAGRLLPEVRTEPLGGGALVRALLGDEAPGWYEPLPRGTHGWATRAQEVRGGHALRGWHGALAPAFAARGAAAERLARAADGAGIVVTTGQQPGLFGGPIYTWSKALSALALADAIQATTGIPTAPVFWAATDDADFVEAASTWIALPTGAERLTLPQTPLEGRPMAEVPLGDVHDLLERLMAAAGSAAHRAPLEAAARSYAPDATVGGAYVALLRELLEPLGIAVLDVSHPAAVAASAPVLRGALDAATSLDEAVRERAAAIEAAGFDVQVPYVPGLTLVAARTPDGGKTRVPLPDAARVAADVQAVLGTTVLLRPVVERVLLPTAAYVAGPGELAYFAQVGAVADAMGLPRPLAVPRWSCTIVEPHVARILERLGVRAEELANPHAPERAVAQRLLPAAVAGPIAELREAVQRAAASIGAGGAALLPREVAEGFARQLAHRIDRLERRYRAAVARAGAAELRDLAAARGALQPGGVRQERALNLLPLLARHGPPLLDAMLDGARMHAASLVGGAAEGAHGTRPAVEAAGR
ncbi:MAG TPA: bacillithiol biosynthesis BshC [Gemmatimonadaceae bacterium]|nr:bacillithiol biosynthesis BshC [Gemmatimonadaceae bacterium]